jgi:hypothetical protein
MLIAQLNSCRTCLRYVSEFKFRKEISDLKRERDMGFFMIDLSREICKPDLKLTFTANSIKESLPEFGLKSRDIIFKLLRCPGIDSKESIPPAYVAWRASATTLCLLGS